MKLLVPTRSAIIGALIGIGIALLAAALGGQARQDLPYVVLLVISVAVSGLILGARAALWGYLAGGAVLLLTALEMNEGQVFGVADLIRFSAFLIGSPIIVFLVYRAETSRALAGEALAASRAVEERLETERMRLEAARREVDDALVAAERERARLEEVA
ncbi:MAG: hypothetical protein KY392_02100, partial [Chloroflexi bacterium]|nr:hypothetical protein [Chloroflexota bacterium]